MMYEFRTNTDEAIFRCELDMCPRIGDGIMLLPEEFQVHGRTDFRNSCLRVVDVVHVIEQYGDTVDASIIVHVEFDQAEDNKVICRKNNRVGRVFAFGR